MNDKVLLPCSVLHSSAQDQRCFIEKEENKNEDHSKHIKINLNLQYIFSLFPILNLIVTFALQEPEEIEAQAIQEKEDEDFYPFNYNIKCR